MWKARVKQGWFVAWAAAAALLAGCSDHGRLWSLTAQVEQGERTPFPPNELATVPLGTGRPLRAGPNGAWVQGTYAVEMGARAGQRAFLREPGALRSRPEGSEVAPPNQPVREGAGTR